jgi:hypothetical protein
MSNEKNEARRLYPVTVNYKTSLAEMIADGDYRWVHSSINEENFSVSGTGEVTRDLELVYLEKDVTIDEVLAYMEANGLRPARIEELIALGATYPEIDWEFYVIALGSVIRLSNDEFVVPFLEYWLYDGYYLNISYNHEWYDDSRFLAVRK